MPNSYFQFKQFTVWHDKCAMKVGTDGVLLGAWTDVSDATSVLDIGTGTGLVALMIAQRCSAEIIAIEIDENAAGQAVENVKRTPWNNRISVENKDFKDFNYSEQFDRIVSNPPYFTDSLLSPNEKRTMARHTNELTFTDLIEGAAKLLAPDGEFSLIIPNDALFKITEIASRVGLYPVRQTNVIPKPGSPPKRALISFSFNKNKNLETEELVVELARHQYSPEYISLTKEFYLKM